MSFPSEPRQLMINMMYLVLTALLALNVSAEILNAFHVVNNGITLSNAAVDRKNEITLAAFERQNEKDPLKTQTLLIKAKKSKELVDALNKQIQEYTDLVIEKSGGWTDKTGKAQTKGWTPEKGDLVNDRDLDVSTRIMVDEGRAIQLKKNIESTRQQLLALVENAADKKMKEEELPLRIDVPKKNDEGELKSWERSNFEMVPNIACVTLLNKFQNDAKNSQAQIMDYLFGEIYVGANKVDTMEAKVIAPSSYIIDGQDYKADIFMAAYSKSLVPRVFVGALKGAEKDKDGNYLKLKQNPVVGGKELDVANGVAKYEVRAASAGTQTLTGAIMVPDDDGSQAYYPFESSFISAKGSAVISPVNLNLIYAGIPNPFSVSVPGFDASKIVASATGGTFTGSNGNYTASMPGSLIGKMVKINVAVKTDNGTLGIGSQEFKVKSLPSPDAMVAGKKEGKIKTGELRATYGPIPTLQNFYFQGVVYNITSYDFIYIPIHSSNIFFSSNPRQQWSTAINDKIQSAKAGDKIIIQNIKARDPAGIIHDLNPVALEVN